MKLEKTNYYNIKRNWICNIFINTIIIEICHYKKLQDGEIAKEVFNLFIIMQLKKFMT